MYYTRLNALSPKFDSGCRRGKKNNNINIEEAVSKGLFE